MGKPKDHVKFTLKKSELKLVRSVQTLDDGVYYNTSRFGKRNISTTGTNHKLTNELREFLLSVFMEYNPWGIVWDGFCETSVFSHTYKKGDWYRNHVDFDIRVPEAYHKLVFLCITECSDNLEGGDWILGENQILTPKVGLAIVMPGYTLHEVTKVKRGFRTSFQARGTGPAFI